MHDLRIACPILTENRYDMKLANDLTSGLAFAPATFVGPASAQVIPSGTGIRADDPVLLRRVRSFEQSLAPRTGEYDLWESHLVKNVPSE